MPCFRMALALAALVSIVGPGIASADPIYLISTRRVFVELGANVSVQQVIAPDNGPFSATVTASDGSNQAMASLASTLSPEGFSGFGVTSVARTSLSPIAISQLIVNFSLTSPHAYSFVGTMDGAGSLGGFLSDLSGQNLFTIPGFQFANVIRQGVLEPGQYQFISGLTNGPTTAGASSFQISLQLSEMAQTPEPGTLILVASGSALLLRRVRRRGNRFTQ